VTELYTDNETGYVMIGSSSTLLENLGINSLSELPPVSPHLPDQDQLD